jgi:cysteine synthase B
VVYSFSLQLQMNTDERRFRPVYYFGIQGGVVMPEAEAKLSKDALTCARVYSNVAELIAGPENPTPLVKLNRIVSNPYVQVYLKLEWYNPFGSVKDRIVKRMLEEAGALEKKTILEASSGNTGIALAALANALGLPAEIVVPARVPKEKKILLRMLGATLWEAEDELCPRYPHEGARGLARSIHLSPERKDRTVYTNQYENEANVRAHYESTGPEIWKQTQGLIDYFFAGFGTTGTLCGVGKFLKEKKASVKIIGIEPRDVDHNLPGLKNISKLDRELVPTIYNAALVDEIVAVEDDAAFETAVELARKEGLLVGPSTGAILHAVLKVLKDAKPCVAVAMSPDSAFKYVSLYEPYVKQSGKPKI